MVEIMNQVSPAVFLSAGIAVVFLLINFSIKLVFGTFFVALALCEMSYQFGAIGVILYLVLWIVLWQIMLLVCFGLAMYIVLAYGFEAFEE